jgi:hypothetical protein
MTIVTAAEPTPTTCAARAMTAQQRLALALDSLDQRRCCVSRLADDHAVSRKFVYAQQRIAHDALRQAFDPPSAGAPGVLFHLPVTKDWLRQFVLVAVLVGHSSLRGCQEMLHCLLDLPVSLGWVHAVVKDAIDTAKPLNDAQDLTRVGTIALDEIFQNQKPVLAVVDVASAYCCSLGLEDHRDGDTWGVRLLDLRDQGLDPHAAIADGGTGLRAGLKQALPGVPCRADVWHPLRDLGEVVRFLENRAYDAIKTADKLQRQLWRRPIDAALRQKAEAARREQDRAIALADGVALLARWLRDDVLCVAGPPLLDRRDSFDLVLKGLSQWRAWCEHRLGPVCSMLATQRDDLLGFAEQMDSDVACLALYAKVSEAVVREMVTVQEMAQTDHKRWVRDAALRRQLGGRYHEVSGLVEALREGVVRGSGAVENLNSRLRNYFFLRKEIGGGYLGLLRFFLNHRRFLRSEHPGRVGKSPAELLSGEAHAHWLELLGYQRFSQEPAAA